jgi:peptide deformylase
MAVKPVLRMGDPRLRRVSEPVRAFATPALRALVADLLDTMRANDGVGIAAPQIGVALRVVIFGFEHNPRYPDAPAVPMTVLVNPHLEALEDARQEGWEGCLSVPGMRGLVPRWQRIRYRGFDVEGSPILREVDGFHARVVQHECDQLDGILYPERIGDLRHFGYTDALEASGVFAGQPVDPD